MSPPNEGPMLMDTSTAFMDVEDNKGPKISSPGPMAPYEEEEEKHPDSLPDVNTALHEMTNNSQAQHHRPSALKGQDGTDIVASSSNSKKSVHFATQASTGDIYCSINEFEKADPNEVEQLFWDPSELHASYHQERDGYTPIKPFMGEALRTAYASSARALASDESIDFDFEAMSLCGKARGMELDACPVVKTFAKRHRKAVLVVQHTLRKEGCDLFDDKSLQMIRKASIKYSRPIRMVATKLAECDLRDSLKESRESIGEEDWDSDISMEDEASEIEETSFLSDDLQPIQLQPQPAHQSSHHAPPMMKRDEETL